MGSGFNRALSTNESPTEIGVLRNSLKRLAVRTAFVVFAVSFSLPVLPPSAHALDKPYDHSVWDRFLKKFVNDQGEVDYGGVRNQPELLDKYLGQLAVVDGGLFGMLKWPREEQLAFWLNAYHAVLVKAVADRYPVSSTNEIPNFWDTEHQKIAGGFTSLSKIQNERLIGGFRDEKIYLALACGAKGCPKMIREAFTGPRVEGQLYLAAKNFVNDPANVEIISGKRTVRLSRIFEWYAADFVLDFGVWDNRLGFSDRQFAVLSFVHHYLADPEKIRWLEEGRYRLRYLPFDWSLNRWDRGPQNASASSASR
jgi:hypothetical protein